MSVQNSSTANYTKNAYDDPTEAPIRIWVEQTDFAISASITLYSDLANPAQIYVVGNPGPGETLFGPDLPIGTHVNVYYVYFDPLNDTGRGTVKFREPILGIVAHTSELQHSDFLRVPGPYPSNPAFPNRGWEEAEGGRVDASRTTLTFRARASSPGDQFRIFTTAAVPEPSGVMMWSSTLLVCLYGYRRKKTRR